LERIPIALSSFITGNSGHNEKDLENKMNDNSHGPDRNRRSFLLKAMAGGSILLGFLLSALLNWIIKKTVELRRKQKQDRYKSSPIYPYKND